MSRMVVLVLAALLTVHGALHLVGFAAHWGLVTRDKVPIAPALLADRVRLGSTAMRVVGSAFLLAALGFFTVAGGAALGTLWWRPLLVVVAAFSLVVTGLDWPVAYGATVVNAVILASVLVSARL